MKFGGKFLDFRRVFRRRWAVGPMNRFAEFIGQPVFVGVVVCMAFLAKEKESAIPAFSHAFFYFTGLYAFWVGLFGSCQSVDSEVQNGEWSYWTLGLRRSIPRHIAAIFGVNLACSLWNVLVFLATVLAVSGFLSLHRDFNPFVSLFLATDGASADSLWQCGYILKSLLVAKCGAFGPLLFSASLYSFSLFAATVCGVCFGMFFSAVFRDPSVALNVSVAFVVLLGMLSLVGLQGDKSRSGARDVRSLDRAFAPQFELSRCVHASSGSGAVDVLVAFSRILPQRYFFNIARLTAEKNIDKDARLAIEHELDSLCGPDEEDFVWWRKDAPMTTNIGWDSWNLDSHGDPDDLFALAGAISSTPGFEAQHRIGLYWRFLIRAVVAETVPMIAMCLFCLLSVNALVLALPVYRQLR